MEKLLRKFMETATDRKDADENQRQLRRRRRILDPHKDGDEPTI